MHRSICRRNFLSPRLLILSLAISPISAGLAAGAPLPEAPLPETGNTLSIETPGPAFVDWKRGVEKQNNAARDARKEIAAASFAGKTVFPLLADDSGYVRDAVFAALEKDASEDQLLALAPGLLHQEPLVAENIAELFGRRKLTAGAPALARSVLRSKFPEARGLMLWALGEIDASVAAETAATVWKKEKRDWTVRAEALIGLAAHDPSAARPAIAKALEEKRLLPLRIVALRALTQIDGPAAFEAAHQQLNDPPKDKSLVWGPRIELAALATLAAVPAVDVSREKLVAVIDALIPSIDEATGRSRRARCETLAAITGEELFLEATSWRSWWTTKRDSWQPSAKGGTPERGGAPPEEKDDRGTDVVSFHGIPVDSERVTFLQDLSGGMSRNLQGESGGSGPTRLDHAKDELERVLGQLGERTWVNVITFASTYFAPHKEPQLLGRARKSLVKFCRQQAIPTQPGHARGNVYDALAYAVSSPHVDTIYLVSEGAPTEGKYHDYERFLWHFERLNRWYGARVHVLLVAETGGRNRNFLDRLSKGTGGEMRSVTTGE